MFPYGPIFLLSFGPIYSTSFQISQRFLTGSSKSVLKIGLYLPSFMPYSSLLFLLNSVLHNHPWGCPKQKPQKLRNCSWLLPLPYLQVHLNSMSYLATSIQPWLKPPLSHTELLKKHISCPLSLFPNSLPRVSNFSKRQIYKCHWFALKSSIPIY